METEQSSASVLQTVRHEIVDLVSRTGELFVAPAAAVDGPHTNLRNDHDFATRSPAPEFAIADSG